MRFGDIWNQHSPEILTGASILGLVTTVALAIKATPRAEDVVLDARERLQDSRSDEEDKEIKKETVKDLAKLYLPAGIAGAATIACMVGSNRVSAGKQAAITAAYTLSNKALFDYQQEVRETFGEKKEREVRERVIEKQIQSDEVKNAPLIFSSGDYLCYDVVTGTKFMCTYQKFKDAILTTNIQLQDEMEVTVSDLYAAAGLYSYITHATDKLHWTIDKTRKIEEFYHADYDENHVPMLVIDYYARPE